MWLLYDNALHRNISHFFFTVNHLFRESYVHFFVFVNVYALPYRNVLSYELDGSFFSVFIYSYCTGDEMYSIRNEQCQN